MNKPPLHIVYLQPEIPQNTGSTARLCAATGIPLHLVGRLGFRVDEKRAKRAGLDYWEFATIKNHDSMETLDKEFPGARKLYFSKKAEKLYSEAAFQMGDFLVFGSETKGLPEELLEENREHTYRIPILPQVRSLNLATVTGIITFEALRQLSFPHISQQTTL